MSYARYSNRVVRYVGLEAIYRTPPKWIHAPHDPRHYSLQLALDSARFEFTLKMRLNRI